MGKQINYYMDCDSFLSVAQGALEFGAVILKKERDKLVQARDLAAITPDCCRYSFYFPDFGPLKIERLSNGVQHIPPFSPTANAVIEAGFSPIRGRTIHRARMYTPTGYYDREGSWIPRPDEVAKVYGRLVRRVKKVAPYVEIAPGKKEYVSDAFLAKIQSEGYVLTQF